MSSRFKPFYRFLSLFLSFSLIVELAGIPFADAAVNESHPTKKNYALIANIGELPNKLPKKPLELTSKRTEYSTRYLNPDGSFTEKIFMEPHFYQDPTDKKWKPIDNTLNESSQKPGKHENAANNFRALFSDQAGSNDLVSVEKNGGSLALAPVNANAVKGSSKGNKMTYSGIFQDTDVQYEMRGDSVKEDIVLNKYENQNTFSFEVNLNGLKPVVEKNGTIDFVDPNGKKVWYFEKPFMVDAAGKRSDQVKLNLYQQNGKTYVDVVADSAFLKNSATQYPVTIDPTINSWDVQQDNWVSSAFPTSIFKSATFMDTGYNGYYGVTRSLVQFFLPRLPNDAKISSATFSAYQTQTDSSNVSIDIDRITSPWSTSVTWNTQPSIGSTPESTTTNNASNAYWNWDVTQLAKDWYNGVQPNYGFMLKQQNETTSPYQSFNTVYSSNYTPELTINYTVDPIGTQDFWMLTKDGVNPANGNLVLQEQDFSIPGRGIPVSVTRTYNNRKATVAGIFGYGWRSNLDTLLVDAGTGPITYIDSGGSRNIFGQKVGGGYESPSGIYLTLVKNPDGTYTITNPDGTKENFNTSGKISSSVDTNGNTTTFTYNGSGQLSSMKDASIPSGRTTTLTYGSNGYVASITDPANRTWYYGYDANGNLNKVTDAAGNVTTLAYDSSHHLTGITNARNITKTINYDTSNRVSSISQPITINGTQQTSTTSYSYDTTYSVTSVTDGNGNRIDYSYNANGNVVQVAVDPLDSANKSVITYAYDDKNNLTQVTDPNTNSVNGSNSYVYTYDGNGNITGVKLPGGQQAYNTYDSSNNLTQTQDFNTNVNQYNYNTSNDRTESTDPTIATSADRYNTNGNQLYSTQQMSTADNLVPNSSFEYSASGNWPDHWTQETESGTTATFAWSATSKFGQKSVSISNPTGWAVVSTDRIPFTAGSTYIASGYVKTSSTAGTSIIKVDFYDSNGNWLNQQVSYGLAGTNDWTRVQAVVDSAPSNTASMDVAVGLNAGSGTAYFDGIQMEKGTTLSAYNLVENSSFERNTGTGNIPDYWTTSGNLSISDGIDNTTSYVGNNSIKLTGQSGVNKYVTQHINVSGDSTTPLTLSGWSKQSGANPSGGSYELQVAINYTDGTEDWSNANDFSTTASGWQHVAAMVNPTKAFSSIDVYYYYYNQTGTAWFDAMRLAFGSSITSNTYDANGNYVTSVKDPLGNTISDSYDAVGNKTGETDAKGNTTSYAYDNNNNLTQVTDANNAITTYGYDGVGDSTSITDANGNQTTYGYNEFNQVSSMTNPLNQTKQFGYDKAGNSTSITYPNGNQVSYTYDTLNRMNGIAYNGTNQWSLGYDPNGNVTSVTNSSGNTTSYTYDANNRLTKVTESASNNTNYGYDSDSNLTSSSFTAGTTTVSTGYNYNSLNQMVSLSRNSSNQAKFVYDERGNVTAVTRADGTYTAYQYDSDNRIQSVQNYNASGSVLDSYTYSYDANGNITSVTTNSGTISYQYDALNQLTQETLLDGTTISYTYDKVGNRTSKTVTKNGTPTTTNYTYDAGNELTAVNGQAYTYDTNGNLTSNGSKTFVYDAENRLIQVKDSNGATIASFTYDKDGKRTSMTTSSGTIYYHYNQNDEVIYETDANNNIVADYTWDDQGHPVTMTKGGVTYYYHTNGHGDVTELTDGNGNVVAQYQYDAWGNIISQSGTMASSNPYRYAGYRYDDATGLYYLMARYYDPSVGRFITRDTFNGFFEDPLSLNQFAYTENNPVMRIDPTGHLWTPWGDISYDQGGNLRFVDDIGFGTVFAFRLGWDFLRFYLKATPGGIGLFVGEWYVGSLYKALNKLIDREFSGIGKFFGSTASKLHQQLMNYLMGLIGSKNINIAHQGLYYQIFAVTWAVYGKYTKEYQESLNWS